MLLNNFIWYSRLECDQEEPDDPGIGTKQRLCQPNLPYPIVSPFSLASMAQPCYFNRSTVVFNFWAWGFGWSWCAGILWNSWLVLDLTGYWIEAGILNKDLLASGVRCVGINCNIWEHTRCFWNFCHTFCCEGTNGIGFAALCWEQIWGLIVWTLESIYLDITVIDV